MASKTNRKRKTTSRRRKQRFNLQPILAAVAAVLLVALFIWIGVKVGTAPGTESNQSGQNGEGGGNHKAEMEFTEDETIQLSQGLEITRIGKYAGIYMEDGSDEVVSGIMMIIVKNAADQDLQLARINLTYADFNAEFEVTNLPAGESVVLLEKNRHKAADQKHQSATVSNVVFFTEEMNLQPDKVELSGGDGYIDVKNISGEDITGDILIYYKNSATDLFYGGITYRARIEGGLKAGETMRVITGHYSEGNCRIVMVTCGE